ncbi:MAG TPA: hypothetical protein VGN37_07990 [Actinocatenispora sp.]
MSDPATVMPCAVSAPRLLAREALFASDLQFSHHPDPETIAAAIRGALHSLGQRGCLERVAQEFGDHPDLAVERMRHAALAAR